MPLPLPLTLPEKDTGERTITSGEKGVHVRLSLNPNEITGMQLKVADKKPASKASAIASKAPEKDTGDKKGVRVREWQGT